MIRRPPRSTLDRSRQRQMCIRDRDSRNPVFVYGYPLQVKPFYVKEDPERQGIALTADLLLPDGFGEVSSGGMREENITLLKSRIKKEGLDMDSYSWYLDLRKYG